MTDHCGTTEEPRELCPCCGGHGMVREGATKRFFTPQLVDGTGVWLGACLLLLAFLLGWFANIVYELL